MIERMTDTQMEPYAILQCSEGTIELQVRARLQEGARNWSAEEAGAWFARQWQDASLALTVGTMARFMLSESEAQLIRQGDVAWQPTEAAENEEEFVGQEQPGVEEPLQVIAAAPQEPTLPWTGDEVNRIWPNAEAQDEAPSTTPDRDEGAEGAVAGDPQELLLTRLIEAGRRGMTVSDLMEATDLNSYHVRTNLKKLASAKRVNEKRQGRKVLYTAK